MKAMLLPCFALAMTECLAQPVKATPYPYSLSGNQFVYMMTLPEPLSSYDYMQREKAYSYLEGAKDATVGMAWCPPRPRKTFELAYDAADYIKSLTLEERKRSAAIMLLAYLGSQYPCPKGSKP